MLDRLRKLEDRFFSRFGGSPLGKLVNRETFSYAFWGVVTTLINVGLYRLLVALPLFAGERYIYAHDIGIVAGKVSAYFANKFFVFRKRNDSGQGLALEVFRFVYTRLFTFFLDHYTLRLLVEVLGGDKMIMKWISTALVVVVNYYLGKFLVFRRNAEKDPAAGTAEKEERP